MSLIAQIEEFFDATIFEIEDGDQQGQLRITRKSPLTNTTNTMILDVTARELFDWLTGSLIQDACPRLNQSEREFLKTGYTDEDWNNIFKEEEQ